MGKAGKRLDRLEAGLEESERKRRKLKERVKALEENLEELEALLEDEDEDEEAEDAAVPSGHRELSEPDASWTVARLREAATSRGLTGVSRLGKADLIAALSAAAR